MNRRELIGYGLSAIAGGGLVWGWMSLGKRKNTNNPGDKFMPQFRVNIYSHDFIEEEKKKGIFIGENPDNIEFCFSKPENAKVDISDGNDSLNGVFHGDYQFLSGRKQGVVNYKVSLNYPRDRIETFDYPVDFETDSRLLFLILEEMKKEKSKRGIGPKVVFRRYYEEYPRSAIIQPSHQKAPVEYVVYGIEAVSGISKKDFLGFFQNRDKYSDFESYLHKIKTKSSE